MEDKIKVRSWVKSLTEISMSCKTMWHLTLIIELLTPQIFHHRKNTQNFFSCWYRQKKKYGRLSRYQLKTESTNIP